MSFGNIPADPSRPPSNAEKAMSANARSRDGQGKAEDRALREHHIVMTNDAAERARGQPGGPAARSGHDKAEQAARSPVASEARSISDALQAAEVD